MKPTYHISNVSVLGEHPQGDGVGCCLFGVNVDNPNCTINGNIITSPIVNRDPVEPKFETLNSIYIVDSWASEALSAVRNQTD